MKALITLVKLHKKCLDDIRLELLREEEVLEDLQKIIVRIEKEMVDEKALAANSLESSYFFPAYIEQALRNQKKINELIVHQEKKIETIREKMAEEFSELKKYEIMLEIKQKEEMKEIERKEQLQLDEIATNIFLKERHGN